MKDIETNDKDLKGVMESIGKLRGCYRMEGITTRERKWQIEIGRLTMRDGENPIESEEENGALREMETWDRM